MSRFLGSIFFDLCEGIVGLVELQILKSGRARDVHASTVSPCCCLHLYYIFYLQAYDAETKEFHDPPSQARNIRSKGKVCIVVRDKRQI